MDKLQICTRCILNAAVPGIEFDENGVCNYCKKHDELVKEFPTGEEGKRILEKKINEIKAAGKGKEYDCIVGVSGGVDSTYTLYLAVKYGLRPLAVLFDNGWNSEIAVSNIKNATSKLGVDLETYVVNYEEFKAILVAFLKASTPHADIPTDVGIKSTLYRTAVENKIKYILTGGNFRTEGFIPQEWSYLDGRYVRSVYEKFTNKKLEHFPNLTLLHYLYYMFIKKINIVRILNYVEYPKEQIKELITKELGWRDYGGKHYESIFTRFNQTYMRYKKFGIDMRLVEYAALVRSGYMNREQALKELQKPPFTEEQLKSDVNYVIKKLGLTEEEFNEIYALPVKTFHDYPTYFPFINAMRPLVNFIQKFVSRL